MRGYAGTPIKLTEEFGFWLDGMQPDTWLTLTFSGNKMTKDAYRARVMTEKWLYGQFHGVERPISHMVAIEKFHFTDYCHAHMLVRGIGDILFPVLGKSWRENGGGGMNKIKAYELDKGANYYITKYTTKDMMDWNISIHNKHRNQEFDPSWERGSAADLVRNKMMVKNN
jgi:hypothetical protein